MSKVLVIAEDMEVWSWSMSMFSGMELDKIEDVDAKAKVKWLLRWTLFRLRRLRVVIVLGVGFGSLIFAVSVMKS